MALQPLLDALDAEISRMQTARALLAGSGDPPRASQSSATPSKKVARKSQTSAPSVTRPRTMSAEGKARIAEGQKRRWANRNAELSAGSATVKKARGKVAGKKAASVEKPAKKAARKQTDLSLRGAASAKKSVPTKVAAKNRPQRSMR